MLRKDVNKEMNFLKFYFLFIYLIKCKGPYGH